MLARELLLSDLPFVADTSAWWRFGTLEDEMQASVQQAIGDFRLWITPVVRMEVLYSARTRTEYAQIDDEFAALRILRNDRAVTRRRDGRLVRTLGAWRPATTACRSRMR